MVLNNICPVPKEQRPKEEFEQLSNCWFFGWPINKSISFHSKLFQSWLYILPLIIIICSGSLYLRNDLVKYSVTTFTASLLLPFVILVRQQLGWGYVYKRLRSEAIEYEESGWYDGQIWEKPIEWRQRDLMIATQEVKPILNDLRKKTTYILSLILLFTLIYYIS